MVLTELAPTFLPWPCLDHIPVPPKLLCIPRLSLLPKSVVPDTVSSVAWSGCGQNICWAGSGTAACWYCDSQGAIWVSANSDCTIPHIRVLGHLCIYRLSLFLGPVCRRSNAKLWCGVESRLLKSFCLSQWFPQQPVELVSFVQDLRTGTLSLWLDLPAPQCEGLPEWTLSSL